MHQRLAVGAELIMRVTEQMIECGLGVSKGPRAALDEHRQIAWHQRRGQQRRLPFVLAFLQELRVGERQIDDIFAAQRADTLVAGRRRRFS